MELGSVPCVGLRPHRKREPTYVILSSSHAKNLDVYFMSTSCRMSTSGRGKWQSYLQIRYRCAVCLFEYCEYESTCWQENDHICRSYIKKSNGPKFADPIMDQGSQREGDIFLFQRLISVKKIIT